MQTIYYLLVWKWCLKWLSIKYKSNIKSNEYFQRQNIIICWRKMTKQKIICAAFNIQGIYLGSFCIQNLHLFFQQIKKFMVCSVHIRTYHHHYMPYYRHYNFVSPDSSFVKIFQNIISHTNTNILKMVHKSNGF